MSETIHVKIIQQFKELRIAKGMSHALLAKKMGVTRPAISHIESGKRKPSLLLSIKLARALGKNLSELLSKAEETTKKKL